MIYAIYRCLYGQDFIQESINSISDFVDKIFVVWDDMAWGDIDSCIYKGNKILFPKKFDNILEKIDELKNEKVIKIYDHVSNNLNQFTHIINDLILPKYEKPDIFMIIEVDHVFRKDQIKAALDEFKQKNIQVATVKQIELWKNLKYTIPERGRLSVIFWNFKNLDVMPETGRHADTQNMSTLNAYVHNLGFCVSENTMYWKHMTAIGFSKKIGDSPPNENWYEDKWLKWDEQSNNRDLEISKGWEHLIPCAYKYNTDELPEILKERLI